jgi:hypothetical protein
LDTATQAGFDAPVWVAGQVCVTAGGGAEPAAAVSIDRQASLAGTALVRAVASGEVAAGAAAAVGDAARPGVAVGAAAHRPAGVGAECAAAALPQPLDVTSALGAAASARAAPALTALANLGVAGPVFAADHTGHHAAAGTLVAGGAAASGVDRDPAPAAGAVDQPGPAAHYRRCRPPPSAPPGPDRRLGRPCASACWWPSGLGNRRVSDEQLGRGALEHRADHVQVVQAHRDRGL